MDAPTGAPPQARPPAWDDGWERAWSDRTRSTAAGSPDLAPARVVRIDKGGITVATGSGADRLVVAAKAVRRVVVGDVVGLDATAGRIEAILPRRTVFERRSPGVQRDEVRLDARALAANMDAVLVLQPLDSGVNPARLCRELVLAWESGATPVVVLTKTDLVDADVNTAQVDLARHHAPGVEVVVASTRDNGGLVSVRRAVAGDGPSDSPHVLALLGASGAGKSSLANGLAGTTVALTADVRDTDRRGRHTTTAGQMIDLGGSTWLIDTPGIRGVGLWACDDGLERAFADLSPFAQDCRFADCTHHHEPGCGLLAAVADGRLTAERLAIWQRLVEELDELEADLERRDRAVTRAENQRARRRVADRDEPSDDQP
ncbi:MAG: ribosome small subunit-dependent GTPase A [Acidobacteria bacterium]|nr:ribosome small subunit-dependent GTPase A [Acidobacteriota bacterium]